MLTFVMWVPWEGAEGLCLLRMNIVKWVLGELGIEFIGFPYIKLPMNLTCQTPIFEKEEKDKKKRKSVSDFLIYLYLK